MPLLAVCGHSGSGKTTLIERVLPALVARKLHVAVVKHDVHAVEVDRPGKDSARLFAAGADVYLQGAGERLIRCHGADDPLFCAHALQRRYDIVLVEGFKHSPWPKVWLLADDETAPPSGLAEVLEIYPRNTDRAARLLALLDEQWPRQFRATPLYGGILIGGASRRMGQPKHLLRAAQTSWIEHAVATVDGVAERTVILGAGALPETLAACARLPDVVAGAGPLSGVLAALRWAPDAGWLIVACDMPDMSRAALDWLLAQRAPGIWAVLPRLVAGGPVEPLGAWYDPRIAPALEQLAQQRRYGFQSLAAHGKAHCPVVPPRLAHAWRNVNTPGEWPAPDGG